MEFYDVIVIGGGPGGYSAAVRASQLGCRTALVEKENLGGTCLNWGCIPTKSLLQNAEVVHLLSKGRTFGFSMENLSIDYAVAHKRSRSVVKRQTRRIAALMKNYNVSVYNGTGRLKSVKEVHMEPSGNAIKGKNIIIATGAKGRQLPGIDDAGGKVINYRQALNLTKVPSSGIIVGAGPIGVEFATIWNRYGCDVTVVELLDRVLPLEDTDISLEAQKQLKRSGIKIKTNARVERAVANSGSIDVTLKMGEETDTLSVETLLASIGVTPNTQDLCLEAAGVETENGNIIIDSQMRTSVPNIFAVGDVTGKLALAHVATAQSMIAAESIVGRTSQELIYHHMPRCIYAYPEVASVGLTEKQAFDQGHKIITVRCPFVANGKAVAMDENQGFVKIVAEAKTKRLLGVHLIGGHVTELIAGPTGMITLENSAEDLGRTVHPHPTMSEAIMEAAHKLCGHAIHI